MTWTRFYQHWCRIRQDGGVWRVWERERARAARARFTSVELSVAANALGVLIAEFLEFADWSRANVEAGSRRWVRIAKDKQDVLVNFPFRDTPEEVLRNQGIGLPRGCRLDSWRRQGWHGLIKGNATVRVSRDDLDGIVEFTIQLFERLFKCPPSQRLDGRLQRCVESARGAACVAGCL